MTIDVLGRDNDQFGLECVDPSLTVQADAQESDINFIVKRFGITGELPRNLEYVTNVDLTEAPDTYHGAMSILMRAQDTFMELPASVRTKFDNDPGLFMDFASDPANIDALRDMGLAVPKVEPAPGAPVPVPPISSPDEPA